MIVRRGRLPGNTGANGVRLGRDTLEHLDGQAQRCDVRLLLQERHFEAGHAGVNGLDVKTDLAWFLRFRRQNGLRN